MEPPRVVTAREVYENEFLSIHKTCMEIASWEFGDLKKEYSLDELLTLCAHHFICWTRNKQYIENRATYLNKQQGGGQERGPSRL